MNGGNGVEMYLHACSPRKKNEERGHLFWRLGVIKSNILKWEGNAECLSEDNDDEEDAVNRRVGGGVVQRKRDS